MKPLLSKDLFLPGLVREAVARIVRTASGNGGAGPGETAVLEEWKTPARGVPQVRGRSFDADGPQMPHEAPHHAEIRGNRVIPLASRVKKIFNY